MKKFVLIAGKPAFCSRNLVELKKQAQQLLNQLQSADNAAQLAKIKTYCAQHYVSLTATLERVESELKAIVADKTALRTSPAKKATIVTAKELLTDIATIYSEALELQRQAELATVQSGELCKFSFQKANGSIETRIGTTAKVAKDQYRKDSNQQYQGGIPSAKNTNYIEFEPTDSDCKCNGFKQFINDKFIGLCPLPENEKAAIMQQFPKYFAAPKTYREPQADRTAQPNALQIEFPAKNEQN
jgi:hypothetical protein